MESKIPFAFYKRVPPGKELLQLMIVIGSGVLSSSVVATVLKAWLDNRKTTLTIQVEGEKKTLEYSGHHLRQDAATIQTIVEAMSEQGEEVGNAHTVMVEMEGAETDERYLLEVGRQDGTGELESGMEEAGERATEEGRAEVRWFRRFLPGRLYGRRVAEEREEQEYGKD